MQLKESTRTSFLQVGEIKYIVTSIDHMLVAMIAHPHGQTTCGAEPEIDLRRHRETGAATRSDRVRTRGFAHHGRKLERACE